MEGAEIAVLMLCTCICGTLLYCRDSPLEDVDRWHISRPTLMGIAIATTTLLTIRSPFGRRTDAHFNPAATLTFFWLGRGHRWDATCYIMAQFAGAVAGVLAASLILGLRLAAGPGTVPRDAAREPWKPVAFLGQYLLSGLLIGVALFASNHRHLTRYAPLCCRARDRVLLRALFFDLRLQRQSGKKLFVRSVRLDMARHRCRTVA